MRRREFGGHLDAFFFFLTSESAFAVSAVASCCLSDLPGQSLDVPNGLLCPLRWALSVLCVCGCASLSVHTPWGGLQSACGWDVRICVCAVYAGGYLEHMFGYVIRKCICVTAVCVIVPGPPWGGAEACGGV